MALVAEFALLKSQAADVDLQKAMLLISCSIAAGSLVAAVRVCGQGATRRDSAGRDERSLLLQEDTERREAASREDVWRSAWDRATLSAAVAFGVGLGMALSCMSSLVWVMAFRTGSFGSHVHAVFLGVACASGLFMLGLTKTMERVAWHHSLAVVVATACVGSAAALAGDADSTAAAWVWGVASSIMGASAVSVMAEGGQSNGPVSPVCMVVSALAAGVSTCAMAGLWAGLDAADAVFAGASGVGLLACLVWWWQRSRRAEYEELHD